MLYYTFSLTAFFRLMLSKVDPLKFSSPGTFHWSPKGGVLVRQDQLTGEQAVSSLTKRKETLETMC